MSEIVPADQIERIVGAKRHAVQHIARAVSSEKTVYILHSQKCLDSGIDLRECPFSLALDKGIVRADWEAREFPSRPAKWDRPVYVAIIQGTLLPLNNDVTA